MHGDVVEVAERILQAFKRSNEMLAPFACPLGREQRAEEFARIAKLLGLDAQLVTATPIELSERFAFLANLAPAPRQLLECECFDRQVSSIADEIVRGLGPQSGLQPGRHV